MSTKSNETSNLDNQPEDFLPFDIPVDAPESAPHSGNIPVEEGGERPHVELPGTLADDYHPDTIVIPDSVAALPEAQKNNRNKIIAGVVATALAAGGIVALVKSLSGGEEHKTQPVAAHVAPTQSAPSTPSATETSAPTPTTLPSATTLAPTPSATSTPEASQLPNGEHVSITEKVVPLADLQKFAKNNAAFKQELLAAHPEAVDFMSKLTVDKALGEGTISRANINNYLSLLKTTSEKPQFLRMMGTLSFVDSQSYPVLTAVNPDVSSAALTGITDAFIQQDVKGSQQYGDSFFNLISLDSAYDNGVKTNLAQKLAQGNNPNGYLSAEKVKVLDAFNVALGPTEEDTVILTYKKFYPDSHGVRGEFLEWSILENLPDGVIADHTGAVSGINFGTLDITPGQ